MEDVAQALSAFLEKHFADILRTNSSAYVRPVLIGPPADAQRALFDLLTDYGTRDWYIDSAARNVAVLHVSGSLPSIVIASSPTLSAPVSKVCQWDYAITVRNSQPLVVMLVDPVMWDNRHESLANTTETIGELQIGPMGRELKNTLWVYLIRQIAAKAGLNERDVRDAFREVVKQSQSLDPATRDFIPWKVADDLLADPPASIVPLDFLPFAAGFPALAGTSLSIQEGIRVIRRLGDLLRNEGLRGALDKLRDTKVAVENSLQPSINALFDHIRTKIFTGTSFERAPSWYYRPGQPIPFWWHTLNTSVLKQMLDEVAEERRNKLALRCENALHDYDVSRGEPCVVLDTVELRASAPNGTPVPDPTFSYRVGRSSPTVLPPVSRDETACVDPTPPLHERPIRYQVEAPGFDTGSVEVLALKSFLCRGMARVRDAERNKVPSQSGGTWKQEITLPRSGFVDLNIYHTPEAKRVSIQTPNASELEKQDTNPGQARVSFVVEVEDNDSIEVVLEGEADSELGRWTITFAVEETTNTARSHFEALVGAHQDTKTGSVAVAQPPDTLAQQYLERKYLTSSESWKPILACWSGEITVSSLQKLDWADPRIGDTFPLVDSRLTSTPPADLLEAREAVRIFLDKKQRPIGQIYLGDEDLVQAVIRYLELYLDWLTLSPEKATWFDCIAVHDATWSQDSNQYRAGSDPVVMLLSPLHPLRLGWHCLAQQQLNDSLHRRCPAAGLLDPDSCPDIGTWYMYEGGDQLVPRVFFALACETPHWAILLSKDMLEPRNERARVLRRISELGIEAKGVVGGFSRSQSIDSLEEVTRLLPGRSTLRVGIVGTGEGSSACVDGIIDWCEQIYGQDEEDPDTAKMPTTQPFSIEVYDLRGETLYPSPERLATLSENTGEKVKWFKKMPQDFQLDLVILDQLGIGSPRGRDGESRSPIGHGALFRVRVREDFLDASWLNESRVGKQRPPTGGIAGLLQETARAFEKVAEDTGVSQFQFQPNRQAISNRLEEATFLAVTSTQIDPAGIIRGTRGQRGYLWDYELPGALGGDENSAGYYLIAEPLRAMRNALKRSVKLVTSSLPSDPEVVELLSEISRRGIPILKRLASGGTEARGELGMLLAVRLIQDAFRGTSRVAKLPVRKGNCVHLLLPVDPYQAPFNRLRKVLRISESAQRPDLLVIAIHIPRNNSPVSLKITPVEVKFRSEEMLREEREEALRQAANLGAVLDAIWVQSAQTPLWDTCTTALLAQCLNLAFRVYAAEDIHGGSRAEWTQIHERVLQDVLSKQAQIVVDKSGRLLVFDGSSSSSLRDPGVDGQYHSAVLNRDDARVLLTGAGSLSPDGQVSVSELKFSFEDCDEQSHAVPAWDSNTGTPLPTSAPDIDSDQPARERKSTPSSAVDINQAPPKSLNDLVTMPPTVDEQDTSFPEPSRSLQEDRPEKILGERRILQVPRAFIGWTEPTSRWTLIGKLDTTGEFVALDLDHPKTVGIFGYMGSGKSYLVGALIEAALAPIPGINVLPSPLALVIFNYRQNVSHRFEMSSLAIPNQDDIDVEKLVNEYSSHPQALRDIHVLCLPGELDTTRKEEYGALAASELRFDPSTLSIEDWELLMGEPGSDALFARTIRYVLGELQLAGGITLERLEEHTLSLLAGQSRKSAELRFMFVRKYVSSTHGIKLEQVLKPGRAVIVDLRNRSLFSREDALRFFLVCANQISRVQKHFNKMIIFDEAHEYLSDEFGDKLESLIRLMRHEGTSYLFATQDVVSIPSVIRKFIATKFVFGLGTRQNVEDLVRFAPEFKNLPLQGMRPGYCFIQTDQSVGNMFAHPRVVRIRPRVTQHGGATQIFSVSDHEENDT
jgi:DNA phosphorothioation-dependent restriction protein DptH